MDPPAVMQTLEEQAEAIGRPLSYLLSRLRINVPGFVATIEKKCGRRELVPPLRATACVGRKFDQYLPPAL